MLTNLLTKHGFPWVLGPKPLFLTKKTGHPPAGSVPGHHAPHVEHPGVVHPHPTAHPGQPHPGQGHPGHSAGHPPIYRASEPSAPGQLLRRIWDS